MAGAYMQNVRCKEWIYRLYEDEINRLRVEKPEYEDEDDESLLIDAYSESQGGDE